MKSPAAIIQLLWWRTAIPARLKHGGVTIRHKASFTGMPIVSLASGSEIVIGARCSLISCARHTALGVNHPVILRTLRQDALIDIGEDTGISGSVICAARSVRIGSNCLLGANSMIFDTDFHSLAPTNRRYNNNPEDIQAAPVNIGNNVFIGAGAIVTKGVAIGDNSIVGAGSVVVQDIPSNVIAAGNPARVIREIPC
ncbi:acyltransferase [Dechloromonas sp. ARDL1]|uniref:acyltransferase n=1 Tax=Dechloromonas sp. ARDL1 TaxID=3322121 RepID=UPI003DA72440